MAEKCKVPKYMPYKRDNGYMLDYTGQWDTYSVEWRENDILSIALKFDGVVNGLAYWIDEWGRSYPMRPQHLEETFSRVTATRGVVTADWIGIQIGGGNGAKYGIRLYSRVMDDDVEYT